RATATVVERTGAASLAHAADAPEIPVVTDTLADGDPVTVGRVSLTAIHLVGHTPGSLAFHYDDPTGFGHVFTGDSLFPGGVGKTGSAAEFDSLLTDVETKLFDRMADDTWIYPGHGDATPL